MNLGDMKQEVLEHEFSETRYSEFVVRQLNRAQLQIADRMDFRTLFEYDTVPTVAGTISYAIPTDYMRLDSVWNVTNALDGSPLVQQDPESFWLRSFDSRAAPTVFSLQANQWSVWPTPDGVYSLLFQYHRSPATMADDSDEPEIDSRCDQLLVRYALARCFERENDTAQAQYHWGLYDKEFLYTMGSINDDADDIGQPRIVEGQWTQPDGITVIRP